MTREYPRRRLDFNGFNDFSDFNGPLPVKP